MISLNFSDLIRFTADNKEILDYKINTQTSFDHEDNEIHINRMNLYLAK